MRQNTIWCNGNITDFDSVYPSSTLGIVTNGDIRLTVKSSDCVSENASSILVYHPNFNIVQLDRTIGYEPIDRSSSLLIETKARVT